MTKTQIKKHGEKNNRGQFYCILCRVAVCEATFNIQHKNCEAIKIQHIQDEHKRLMEKRMRSITPTKNKPEEQTPPPRPQERPGELIMKNEGETPTAFQKRRVQLILSKEQEKKADAPFKPATKQYPQI